MANTITWSKDMNSIDCIDGNPYIKETSSAGGTRHIKLLFDYDARAVTDCYPVTKQSLRWGDLEDYCDTLFHIKYQIKRQQKSAEDAMNLKWANKEGTWTNVAGMIRYMGLTEFNSPDCGGIRDFDTFKWGSKIDPDRYTYCDFLNAIEHTADGCHIPFVRTKTQSHYLSTGKYSGERWSTDSNWVETGETKPGNTFDCSPFEADEANRIIQWEMVAFDKNNPDTYICEDEKTYEKWISVSYTDDFGKTKVPYTGETRKGSEIEAENMCAQGYVLAGTGRVPVSTYSQQVITPFSRNQSNADYINSTYDNYPDNPNTNTNTTDIMGPGGISGTWGGNYTFEAHFDKTRDFSTITSSILDGTGYITGFTAVPQELCNFSEGLRRTKNANYFTYMSLAGWKLEGYVAQRNIFRYLLNLASDFVVTLDISECDEDFKEKVKADRLAEPNYSRGVTIKE